MSREEELSNKRGKGVEEKGRKGKNCANLFRDKGTFCCLALGLQPRQLGALHNTHHGQKYPRNMERSIKKGDSGDELKVCYYGVISQSAYLLSATTPCTRSGFRVCWSSSTAPIVVALFRHFNFHNTSMLLFVFLDLLMTYWFLSASTRERLSLAESSFGLFSLRADGLESSSVTDNPDSNRVDQHKYYANFWKSCRHT